MIGLGNPGAEYADTRHNAGFWVIDALAERLALRLRLTGRSAREAKGAWRGHPVLLVKPETYMNRSGVAVKAVADAHRLDLDRLIVVYDDLDLPPGVIRMRQKGSSGGHKGMDSIIHYLGTQAFPRLRIGIGPVPSGWTGADFVLSPPERDEKAHLDAAVQAAVESILIWVDEGIERAMARGNRVQRP